MTFLQQEFLSFGLLSRLFRSDKNHCNVYILKPLHVTEQTGWLFVTLTILQNSSNFSLCSTVLLANLISPKHWSASTFDVWEMFPHEALQQSLNTKNQAEFWFGVKIVLFLNKCAFWWILENKLPLKASVYNEIAYLGNHRNGSNPVYLANIKLSFGVVVVESHCQHILRALTDCATSLFKRCINCWSKPCLPVSKISCLDVFQWNCRKVITQLKMSDRCRIFVYNVGSNARSLIN